MTSPSLLMTSPSSTDWATGVPSREKVNSPPPPRLSADRRRRCRAVQYLGRRHRPAGWAPRSHRRRRRRHRFKGTRPGGIRLPLWRRDIMCCRLGILLGATQPRRQTRCCGGAQLDWCGSPLPVRSEPAGPEVGPAALHDISPAAAPEPPAAKSASSRPQGGGYHAPTLPPPLMHRRPSWSTCCCGEFGAPRARALLRRPIDLFSGV